MRAWKQLLVSVVIAAIAFFAWAKFYPGAGAILAGYGIDWFAPAAGGQAPGAGSAGGAARAPAGRGGFSREALVVVRPVAIGTVNDRLTAIGTGQAVRRVTIRPLVAGQIVDIPVESGAAVSAGDVIVRLDSEEQKLAVERAKLNVGDAERKAARLENLLAQRAVSTVDADTARSELAADRVALQEAELALSRRTVTAPISGTLGILSVNGGDYVTTSSDITTIDDRSKILVEFYVPERFAARMAVGKTISATAVARPGDVFQGDIVAVDNRVDEASRTLRVQARIPNDRDLLRAGMSFEVTMQFEGDNYPSIDPLAIQWDSKGSYLWRVVDGKAQRVDIAIIQRNADRVLVKGELAEGDQVVTEGVQSVRAGGAVAIDGQPRNSGQAPGANGAQRPQEQGQRTPAGVSGEMPRGSGGAPRNGA